MDWRIGIVTASDRVSRGRRPDLVLQALQQYIVKAGIGRVSACRLVSLDRDQIRSALLTMINSGKADLILTTGGTGLGPRAVTPEATRAVIEREVPGLAEAMRMESLRHSPSAALSRALAGVRGGTLIVNLPGRPAQAIENLAAISRILPHALDVLARQSPHHDAEAEVAAVDD